MKGMGYTNALRGGAAVKKNRVSCIVMILILCLAAPVLAQWSARGQGLRLKGEFKPVLGSWAEYRIQAKGESPSTMKIAIVGKEGPAYWYETVTKTNGDTTVTKMLVSGDPMDSKAVKRIIIKHASEQAMEMPVMEQPQRPSTVDEAKVKIIDKGMETVKVPAGTFKAHHLQYVYEKETVDAWGSDKVPPYCMVKSLAKDFEMALTAYGMGAKTMITETPKKFQMPKMPAGMPKGMMPQGMNPPSGK